jgi:exopolyphosphatase/guanosine-5'-triphosphate,3'-diphosphate pyrophosphatase
VRIAAIDIGTNSIHMVIAAARGHSGFEVIDRERDVVQVGRSSFDSGRLRRDAMQRAVLSLKRFVQLARRQQVDKIICTATAAVREAANGGEFLQMCRDLAGVSPRVIPAEEEGRLIYMAVRSALRLEDGPILIVDIGGGSMQLALGDREKLGHVVSAPLGALRLTELLLAQDPPAPRELARLQRVIRRGVREAFRRLGDPKHVQVYGSSGSIHALAHAANAFLRRPRIAQMNGHKLATGTLVALTNRLVRMPMAQRERLPEIDDRRAEILVPGALVLAEILRRAKASGITVSDFGLREGLVTDYLEHHVREVAELDRVDDLRLRSVLGLVAKFGPDGPHPAHVVRLSLELFDALASEHGLGPEARELLQYAAYLHDVGAGIGYDGHAQHSYYVIRNGNLRGMSAEEVEIVANVARYHGKARPRKRDEAFAELAKPARRVVRWLSAIMRIAEGLDRSHYQLVRALRVVKRGEGYSLFVRTRRDANLELWAARRRVRALEKLLGGTVRVSVDPRYAIKRPVGALTRGEPAEASLSRADAPSGRGARAPEMPRTPRGPRPAPSSRASSSAAPAPSGRPAASRGRGSSPGLSAGRAVRGTEH